MKQIIPVLLAAVAFPSMPLHAQTDASPTPAADASASPSPVKHKHKKKAMATMSPTPTAGAVPASITKTTAEESQATTGSPTPAKKHSWFKKKADASASVTPNTAAGAVPSTISPSTTAKKPMPTPSGTAAPGGGPGMVWVNTSSHVYHKESSKWYGRTKQGKYMSEADAIKEGDHASKSEK